MLLCLPASQLELGAHGIEMGGKMSSLGWVKMWSEKTDKTKGLGPSAGSLLDELATGSCLSN